jgi:hypothetical protein
MKSFDENFIKNYKNEEYNKFNVTPDKDNKHMRMNVPKEN